METVYYTPKEVAERLRLRVQTVYDYIRQGRLPAVRLGNRCRISHSDLEAFLAHQKSSTRPRASGGERATVASTSQSSPLAEPQSVADQLATNGGEQMERNKAARRLLAEWMADESGYDEQAWPIVEQLLEQYPVSLGDPTHD
jgi:excisionase family DNA binding protein